jgi:hypothetical protein
MAVEAFFWLVCFHFLVDFQLQTEFIAETKTPGRSAYWPITLSAHSFGHGLGVAIVLGPYLGLLEAVTHAVVDLSKAKGLFGNSIRGFYVDQAIHIFCKVVWIAIAVLFDQLGVILQS